MKRPVCVLLVVVFIIPLIPIFSPPTRAQALQLRTVWENPCTLTTYHPNGEVNSTFYTCPKVIWNGSQYVDYILNTSDMSAGIGSVYLKVLPDHTIFYDPYQTEEAIKSETWMVEHYDASSSSWETYDPVDESVHQSVNSSGIYFDRTTTLHSGAALDEWYWLRIGSEMEISVVLRPAQSGEYRLSWLLSDVSGMKAQWLTTAENVTTELVDDRSCSRVRFASENESKCLVDWSDACFFNETAEKWETYFQELKMERDVCDSGCQARVSFGDFSLNKGESAVLDPYVVTFNSSAALDGYIEKYGVSYPPNGGTIVETSGTVLGVGQYFVPGVQYITDRSYLSFDTSSVPALAHDISATLRLKASHDSSTVDFAVQVWGGNQPRWNGNLTILDGIQPIYGDSLTGGSWGTGRVKVATWNTANYPGNGVYINLTIPSNQINKTGSTQFELNSSRDGTNDPHQNYDEGVNFYSGNSTGNEPKLEVSYQVDTITVNGETWFYRNVSTSKVVILLFGAYPYSAFVKIRSIDCLEDPPEKSFGKIQFIDALIENGFSVFTPSHDSSSPYSYYDISSTWVQDLTLYLMCNQTYTKVYLFGHSGGGVVVGNEIQKDYASRFSAAVMNCAPVDWSGWSTDQIYHTALTASKAKVATSFPENVWDRLDDSPPFYTQEKEYYDNAIVDKEWHNWTGLHADFFTPNDNCIWHTCSWPSGENDSVAVISWFNAAHPPSTPFTPTGTQTGYVSTSYSYTSGTVDSDGENVSYQFNWGDGTNTTTGFYASGTNASCNHAWSNPGSYNVTVRAQDTSQTWSCWSPLLTVSMAQNQGGGGGCPYVYDWNGTKFLKDNNILSASEAGNGTDTRDYYLLQQPLVPVFATRQASVYLLQIREFESEEDYIDQVKLIAVDHAQGTSIAVTPEGGIVTYQNPASPLSCMDNYGNNRLGQIGRMDGNVSDPSTFFQGYEGDWLLLDFGRVSTATANLIFRDDQKCCEYCINVQVPDANGAWQTVEVLNPRDFWGIEAVNMAAYLPKTGDFIVRLLWTAPHRLDYVGLDTSSQAQTTVNSAPPALAIHSTMGCVTAKLLYDDENCVELVNGQQITLAFTLPNKAQGTTRDFILYTDGYYYTITP